MYYILDTLHNKIINANVLLRYYILMFQIFFGFHMTCSKYEAHFNVQSFRAQNLL